MLLTKTMCFIFVCYVTQTTHLVQKLNVRSSFLKFSFRLSGPVPLELSNLKSAGKFYPLERCCIVKQVI